VAVAMAIVILRGEDGTIVMMRAIIHVVIGMTTGVMIMEVERRERMVIIIIMMGGIIIQVATTGGVQIINGRIMGIRIGMKMTTMADGSLNSSNNSISVTHPRHNLEDLLTPISDQTGQERPGDPPMKTTTDLDQTGMELPVLSMDEDPGRGRLGHLPQAMHIHNNNINNNTIHIIALLHLDHHRATHPLNNNNPIALAHNLEDLLPTTANILSLQATHCTAPTPVRSHEAPQPARTPPDRRPGAPINNNHPKLPTPPCNVPARKPDVSADPPTSPAINQATITRRTCYPSNAICVIGNDTK